MRKHTTKHALVMSALSLLVCVSMLVGSTFAWFTDSVSSDRNIIQAGNLDVTLEYWDGDSYEEVTSSTKLFNDAALWEPGHAEVAYLRIDNAGSLALKYQLAVNVYNETPATNVAGETFKLSDHLVFSVVDKALTSRDDMFTREQAIAAAGNAMGLSSYNSGTVEMLPTDEPDCVALIIYMPTSVGNEANYRGTAPTIELGTTLVATQLASEQDSFGNDYDKDATYPVVYTARKESNVAAPLQGNAVKVEVPANAPAGSYTLEVANKVTATDEQTGKTTVSYDINLLKDGVKVQPDGTVVYPVSIHVGTMLDIDKVFHNGNEITDFDYDCFGTGDVSFETASFSPFSIVFSEPEVLDVTAKDMQAALNSSGSYSLTEDVVLDSRVNIPEGVTVELDLNGYTLSTANSESEYALNNMGNLTIKDTSAAGTGTIKARGIYNGYGNGGENYHNAKLVIENGTFNAMGANGGAAVYNYGIVDIKGGTFTSVGGYALNSQSSSKMTVSNASVTGGIYNSYADITLNNTDVYQHISGRHAVYVWSANLEINGGKFDSISGNELILADGQDACVVINSGTFNKTAKSWLVGAATGKNITFTINGGTFNGYVNLPENSVDTIRPFGDPIVVYGGTYNFDPTTWVAEGYLAKDNGDGKYVVASAFVSDAASLETAIKAGGTIVLEDDIAMTKNLSVSNANVTLNGNGHTITLADGATNNIALFDVTGGKIAIKDITFDGIKGGAIVRTVYAESIFDNVTVVNSAHTQQQGLLRLIGKATVTNCTFENNTCNFVITFGYDDAPEEPFVVSNCVFRNNTCNDLAVVYYAGGTGATIDGNQFISNTAKSGSNAATLYLGFMENCVVTNNLFHYNSVTTTGTSKRATGGLMVGHNALIRNNSFVGNTISASNAKGNDVCASVYYCDIDLSGNYWGGGAPVENDDYFIEYPDSHKVIINDYLTSYEF